MIPSIASPIGDWVGQDVGVDVCDFAPHLAMLYGRNC